MLVFGVLGGCVADLRLVARRLGRRKGFTTTAVVVAALGIGATTAVFSAVDAAMLRPLPFERPAELVTLTGVEVPFYAGPEETPTARSAPDITDVAVMTHAFRGTAAFASGGLNLTDAADPRRLRVGVVTIGFFETIGVRPQVGRTFGVAEGEPARSHAVILSDALWSQRFGQRDVLGKQISLNGRSYEVVGIMPRGFTFPNESDAWIPLTVPMTFGSLEPFRGFIPSRVVARLAPGVEVAEATSRMLVTWRRIVEGYPAADSSALVAARSEGLVIPLQRQLLGDRARAFEFLVGASVLLLLVTCANLASLLLADAAARRRDVAVRLALGASRARIVRQLLTESVLLGLAGAAVGVAMAPGLLLMLRELMPADLIGVASAEINLRVLVFAASLALVAGSVFGLWPALTATRGSAADAIKSGDSLGTTAAGLGAARRSLVVAEIALTAMLLVGAGVMLRSLERVLSRDLGIRPEQVGALELSLERGTPPELVARVREIIDHLERDPAIEAAAAVNDLPLRGGGGISLAVEVDGATALPPPGMRRSRYLLVSGSYFQTLGVPLLRGRTFAPSDESAATPVAIISATMARAWWPSTNPVGSTFRLPGQPAPVTIIGVAADVRSSIEGGFRPQVYFPVGFEPPDNVAIVARSSSLEAGDLLARITAAVRAVDPTQAVYNTRMMDDVMATALAARRTNTALITAFAAVGLLLSATGVYAVVSYASVMRRREFAIRAALGATSGGIVALLARETAMMLVMGLVIGLAGAWAFAWVMGTLVFEVEAHDLVTFTVVPLLIGVTVLLATIIPAKRAMQVSPAEAMRSR